MASFEQDIAGPGTSVAAAAINHGPQTGATRSNSITAFAKISLRSPATMGGVRDIHVFRMRHCRRKLCAPSSLRTSDKPPRTNNTGRDRLSAAALRRWRYSPLARLRRKAGSQCHTYLPFAAKRTFLASPSSLRGRLRCGW